MLRINHYNSLFCVRSMSKLYMKYCFILWSHILLTCFVFDWVVEASAACFVDCLAYVLWQQRGLGAGFSLISSFTVLLLCISDLMILVMLICITACVWCFFIFYCFSAQCCSIAACCIVMICKHAFFTFIFSNSEGFWCVNLSCSYSWQLNLLTELTECLHDCATGELVICRRELMTKSFMYRKNMTYEYVGALNH